MQSLRNFKLPHNKINEFSSNTAANNYVRKNLNTILEFIGVNVLAPNFTVGPKAYFLIFMTHSLVGCFFLMLFNSNISISHKLEAMCLTCIICQGLYKFYTSIALHKFFAEMGIMVSNLHLEYANDPVIAPALKKLCGYCTILFELLAGTYYSVAFTYSLLPVFMWKKFGIFTTIFPMQFPIIDWHTPFGYLINTINHVYVNIIGPTGIIASDVIFTYLVLHSIGYIEIMRSRIDKLNSFLESGTKDLRKIKLEFYRCIQAHQDYISYIETIDKGHSLLCLCQLATSEMILTLSLFLTVWSNWVIGPFLVLSALFQLLEYCILGTVVTTQNENALNIIYGMKWYLLPAAEQKLVVLMLLRGQSSPELSVGGFAKLNVETCMQVLKTTYSYLMMMLKFVR